MKCPFCGKKLPTLADQAARLRISQSEIAQALKMNPASVSRAMDAKVADRIRKHLDRQEARYQARTHKTTKGESS